MDNSQIFQQFPKEYNESDEYLQGLESSAELNEQDGITKEAANLMQCITQNKLSNFSFFKPRLKQSFYSCPIMKPHSDVFPSYQTSSSRSSSSSSQSEQDQNQSSSSSISLNVKMNMSDEINETKRAQEEEDEYQYVHQQIPKQSVSIVSICMNGQLDSEQIQEAVSQIQQQVIRTSKNSKQSVINPIKALVSKQKVRYNLDGFDLDLTYITERIIAFGFPAENVESVYRNSMSEVKKFFNMRHSNQYMIINLCQERKYKHSHFNNMVKEFPFQDHHPPPFSLIFEACQFINIWLKKDPNHVIGIHCKAGKGRTGLIICCYLMYENLFTTAKDALRYYDHIRTKNKKGVTIPSQIRYVQYFEKALKAQWKPNHLNYKTVMLQFIKVMPAQKKRGQTWYEVKNGQNKFSSKNVIPSSPTNYMYDNGVTLFESVILNGDVLVQCYNSSLIGTELLYGFWFHTEFVSLENDIFIEKSMLDIAVRDKKNKKFSANMTIQIHFEKPKVNQL